MPGKVILLVMTEVEAAAEEAFNRWYSESHLPKLLSVPGFLSGVRYRALEGRPKYLAAYELADASVLESEAYKRVRAWGPEAAAEDREMLALFRDTMVRGLYERLLTLPDPEPADLSAARGLLLVGLEVPPQHEEEFNAWYDTEHLPALAAVPGVLRARRGRLLRGAGWPQGDPEPYVALYDLERPEVQASEAWLRARETPWSTRILRKVVTRVRRNVYERM